MELSKTWNYEYNARCECSDDDRCGCSYPSNMGRSFVLSSEEQNVSAPCCKALVGQLAHNFSAPAVFADGTTSDMFDFFDYIADICLSII